jgi:hypothetical protein
MDEKPINKEQERSWKKNAIKENRFSHGVSYVENYRAVHDVSKRGFMNTPALHWIPKIPDQ